jgi:hypothetical protein
MAYDKEPRKRRRSEGGPYEEATYEAVCCHDVPAPMYAEGRPSSYMIQADAGDDDPPMTSAPLLPAEGDVEQRAAAKRWWARTSHLWFGNECWTTHEEAPDEWFRWNDVKNKWDIYHGPAWAEVVRQEPWAASLATAGTLLGRFESLPASSSHKVYVTAAGWTYYSDEGSADWWTPDPREPGGRLYWIPPVQKPV